MGWAGGLALAAASLARSADPASFVADFAGDDRLVVDYLASELWDGLADETKEVMLATSILDQMCGPLVQAVAEIDSGGGWLEEVAKKNQLLISLDEHRHWYRYHHLLRDLLRDELSRTTPDHTRVLHSRAAEWLCANGYDEDAIRHAFAADDVANAASLVVAAGERVIQEGHLGTLQGWLDQLARQFSTTTSAVRCSECGSGHRRPVRSGRTMARNIGAVPGR